MPLRMTYVGLATMHLQAVAHTCVMLVVASVDAHDVALCSEYDLVQSTHVVWSVYD